jgi:hypothetical protein
LPRFISRISVSTFLPALGEYLRADFFLEVDFFAAVRLLEAFFAVDFLAVDFFVADFRAEDFFAEDFFRVDLVAIIDLLRIQMARSFFTLSDGNLSRSQLTLPTLHSSAAPRGPRADRRA